MQILTINSGSSSIKFKVLQIESSGKLIYGLIEKIGESISTLHIRKDDEEITKEIAIATHQEGFAMMQSILQEYAIEHITRVGHRVVHGGDLFSQPTLITDEVVAQIEALTPLAPLHNPSNLLGIQIARQTYPDAMHLAIFDTAFHATMPPYAYRYAIENKYYEVDKIRRYGFHGTSHSFVAKEFMELTQIHNANLITVHLGNGASICAIKEGVSIDTSMGFTPLEGLVMGTRSGDLDPSIAFYIAQKYNLSPKAIDDIFNKQSGLKGLCGIKDMREIIEACQNGNEEATLAMDIFCYRIKKYIGAYMAIIGRVDGIVFTGGIGENAGPIRAKVLSDLHHLSIYLDETKNNTNELFIDEGRGIKLAVIPTNEELEMARLVAAF
ncbi:MAG: acetate kinase [Campylobacterales bacterium]|nr:acetate kinase [Campylobacterales bacterium]